MAHFREQINADAAFCYYFNTTLLLNLNTFLFQRLMVFLTIMYRERSLTTNTLNVGNHGLA